MSSLAADGATRLPGCWLKTATTMTKHHRDTPSAPQGQASHAHGTEEARDRDTSGCVTTTQQQVSQPKKVARGITQNMASTAVREAQRQRSLELVNRFRVIRTIDIAVYCCPERPFKAALSSAQRAVRAMVKDGLLARYRTDRFQTVYGLTQRGASWLEDRGVEASASVRRVTDMSNPEHRLWAQFITLSAEARGLKAQTEQELLQTLANQSPAGKKAVQGLLRVRSETSNKALMLRPDALVYETDGLTWVEIDRSARGADRAASLRALARCIGAGTTVGTKLRRVVVFTRNERIRKRVIATLVAETQSSERLALTEGRRCLKWAGDGVMEVWQTVEERLKDGRSQLVDVLAGHVIVQELPTWLPRVRLDGRGGLLARGWLSENYLPYQRQGTDRPWPPLASPLLPVRSS